MDTSLHVMTFNIRYDNNWDTAHSWDLRKTHVLEKIKTVSPTTLGIQEGMLNQVTYLKDHLAGYDYVGIPRGDGKTIDEFAAIFYKKDQVELLDSHTFWLSETPDVIGSFGWDAACTRICTWAKFRLRDTDKVFFHFNTHLDHEGIHAQEESAKLLLRVIGEVAGPNPALLTGDFNVTPDSRTYAILTGLEPIAKDDVTYLIDSILDANGKPLYTGTFTDFGRANPSIRIDYILTNTALQVNEAAIMDEPEDIFTSDHYPVRATLRL